MPQFVILAAIAVGGFFGWKFLKREMARVGRELDRVRERPTDTLTQDPKTGRYRVKDRR